MILAVDSSTKNVGLCFYQGVVVKHTECLTFVGKYSEEMLRDLSRIFREIILTWEILEVYIEAPIVFRNPKVAMALSQVVGCLVTTAYMYNCKVELVNNKTVKKTMGIKTKEDSINKFRELNPDYKGSLNEHIADASMVYETVLRTRTAV